jgi:hypothetical protein
VKKNEMQEARSKGAASGKEKRMKICIGQEISAMRKNGQDETALDQA